MASKIENVTELRNDLINVYQDLRSGKLGLKEAKQTALVANTIVSTCKVQMDYNEFTKSDSKIPFLES
jgi:hypothetical protein